jgi:hypothetical protein
MLDLAFYSHMPNKETWWRAEKGLSYRLGHAMRRGKVIIQPIFSYVWGTDMSYRFKKTNNWGPGERGSSPSLRCGLILQGFLNNPELLSPAGGLS